MGLMLASDRRIADKKICCGLFGLAEPFDVRLILFRAIDHDGFRFGTVRQSSGRLGDVILDSKHQVSSLILREFLLRCITVTMAT